jgi:hypothetical protein
MFEHPSFDQHERGVFAHRAALGRPACMALHVGTSAAAMEIAPDPARYASTADLRRIPVRLPENFACSSAPHRPTGLPVDMPVRRVLAEAR